MISSKSDFLRTFLPEGIEDVHYAQVDLDISDLSIADILRNANRNFPINTRNRNAIISGDLAIAILCKTETLFPLSGLLLIITNDELEVNIVSKNYIVISLSEDKIKDDVSIKEVTDSITRYLIQDFKDSLQDFNEFYVKFVYNEDELENDN